MKVSVIIPYKVDRGFLNQAIQSVENQNYSGEIEIIQSQSDASVCRNINEGFKQADGDLVRFLCDDDMLNPDSIRQSVEFFKLYPGIDFIHSNAITIDVNGKAIGDHVPYYTPSKASELSRKNYIHGGTVVYRRKCFEDQMWDEALWTGEEYEYNMRLLSKGFKLGYLNAFTYMYRKHKAQKSYRGSRNLKARIKAISEIKAMYR